MRQRMELWFTERQIHTRTVGEFDDAALMKAFGREGRGVFMSPTVLETETCEQYGVKVLGRTEERVEEFYAVSVERRIKHPFVVAIPQAARSAPRGTAQPRRAAGPAGNGRTAGGAVGGGGERGGQAPPGRVLRHWATKQAAGVLDPFLACASDVGDFAWRHQ